MEKKKKKEFNYRVMPDFDFVIEESGSNSLNLRKIAWNSVEGDNKPYKLDLRKYSYNNGEERMLKGCTIYEEKVILEIASALKDLPEVPAVAPFLTKACQPTFCTCVEYSISPFREVFVILICKASIRKALPLVPDVPPFVT